MATAACKFTHQYRDYEREKYTEFKCNEESLDTGLCIFHDENYFKDKDNPATREQNVINRLMDKVNKSISDNEALICIGYHLPAIKTGAKIFTKPVYFVGCKFLERTNFDEFIFKAVADFSEAEFYEVATFSKSTFEEEVIFYRSIFQKGASFYEASFQNRAAFRNATFQEVDFDHTKFQGFLDFSVVKLKRVCFNEAIFQETYFPLTTFQGPASFEKATFEKPARFDNATFQEGYFVRAKFQKATFSLSGFQNADFRNATFEREIDFWATRFEEADFHNATFQNEPNFTKATFKIAYFNDATFKSKAYFTDCTFQETDFSSATFQGEAKFNDAKFRGAADFSSATFQGPAHFSQTNFQGEARFIHCNFQGEARFIATKFGDKTSFNYTLFEGKEKIIFDVEDLSIVSFLNTDITQIRFGENVVWRKQDRFKVADEEMLENPPEHFLFDWDDDNSLEYNKDALIDFLNVTLGLEWVTKTDTEIKKDNIYTNIINISSHDGKNSLSLILNNEKTRAILYVNGSNKRYYEFIAKGENNGLSVYYTERVSLGSIKAIYRNLRENYEYRLRYDEAGQFFIKEMELKRNYREKYFESPRLTSQIKRNGFFRRHFSLTGWYYHLSRYGEDLVRPTIVGGVILTLSTFFWLMQSNPTLQPTFSANVHTPFSNFTGLAKAGNLTHWNLTHWGKAFERSFSDFIPLLPSGSDVKVGLIDYVIKIVGGAFTFGLIAIALRRKFERRFRH